MEARSSDVICWLWIGAVGPISALADRPAPTSATGVAALLALLSAVCFALAAALQQRGRFSLARGGEAVEGVTGLVRLIAVPVWLLGTLDAVRWLPDPGGRAGPGQARVVQPLLVTTIVWALPLGSLAHGPERRPGARCSGPWSSWSGLALFVLVGDPDAGVDNASTAGYVIATLGIGALVAVLLLWLHAKSVTGPARGRARRLCRPLLGLSASFAKPVINDLHDGIGEAAGDGETWALLGFGFLAFVIQQMSLATGQLTPAMAAVSVSEPGGQRAPRDHSVRRAARGLPARTCSSRASPCLPRSAGAVIVTLADRENAMPGSRALRTP